VENLKKLYLVNVNDSGEQEASDHGPMNHMIILQDRLYGNVFSSIFCAILEIPALQALK
jgi:hypothetical protein